MSKMDTPKKNNVKPAAKAAAPAEPVKVPPMCRRVDWLTFGITFLVIWAVYLWTLAPQLTLEDSGELCTGSFYAGIPHPPGYPFWAIYSWFWTFILPIGNVAWRVEVGQSFAGAMGCGMLALMVSRGSSMLIEGIEELKGVSGRWENAICMVSGLVAGLLLGLDGFMWSESVVINRISVFGVPWLIAVMLCLMRWMYAPQQRRYLYLAMLLYGICATIHQTLLLSAMGVEIIVAMASVRLGRDLFLGNSIIYVVCLLLMQAKSIPALNTMSPIEVGIFHIVGVGSILATGWLATKTGKLGTEWKVVLIMGLAWMLGVSFYLYMPISCMTDPPMQWGYPRTVEGFFHALSRGQYQSNTSTLIASPSRIAFQLWYLVEGLSDSFSWVLIFIGLLPFFFLHKMHKRERGWIIGLTAVYFCLSVILVRLLDVTPDRSASDLNEVFFIASHGLFTLMIGYGTTILAAYMATHYAKFRLWGFIGGIVGVMLALYCLVDAAGKLYYGPAGEIDWFKLPHYIGMAFNKDQYALPIFANLVLLAVPVIFIGALAFYRTRGPVAILLGLFMLMPVYSGMTHWYKSEQRNHWFGYWFGHDMFTPPFKDPQTGQLSYDNVRRAELLKDPKNAKLIYPEMARNTILFGGTDPGRFCPTYIIFCESFIPHRCQPKQDQHFDRRDVYIITQNALADGTYLDYLRAQYNRSEQIDPPFFSELSKYIFSIGVHGWRKVVGSSLTKNFKTDEQLQQIQDPQMRGYIQQQQGMLQAQEDDICRQTSDQGLFHLVNWTLDEILDRPFTAWGKYVEGYRRARGVYPPNEIYIPSGADSQKSFEEYTQDAARRAQLNQLSPGEEVHVENGHVQVSGQVAVMKINGLLCKVIFDQNPTNEFYVEESFPLDWMYPHETPFGVIMKINRQPVTELTQDMFDLDHKFWTDFAPRLCGNWITYDTTVQQIADFAERTYIGNNYKGYTGDRAFIRDDSAQKAFSKLRSSQAGMYAWRLSPQCPPEYRQKTPAAQAALIRETDFAFKQAFAFCPYSPEAVFRYINFLLPLGRFDDALIVAQTCQKLDPYNQQIIDLIETLKKFKQENDDRTKAFGQVDKMEKTARTNPGNFQNLIALGVTYAQMQETNRAIEMFDQALTNPGVKTAEVSIIASYFSQFQNLPKLEVALQKLVDLDPAQADPHYDLAALQAYLGHTAAALTNLQAAVDLSNQRLKTNPTARDLVAEVRRDPHFNSMRPLPEFQKLIPPK